MQMKKMIRLKEVLVITALGLTFTAFARAGLDRIYHNGSVWIADPININTYEALATDGTRSTFAARVGSLDKVYHNGSVWVTESISSNTYDVLANDGPVNSAFGARAGSLDKIYHNGSVWVSDPLNSNSYATLASDGMNSTFGARTGSLDKIYHNGSAWVTESINSNTYTVLATDGLVNETFATRSGSLDRVYHNGSAWVAESITSNTYVALATDGTRSTFAARAGGGLDKIYHNGSAWVVDTIGSNSYVSLTCDGSVNSAFGARAGGGVDKIYHNGSAWVVEPVNSNIYEVLAGDGLANETFSAEPIITTLLAPVAGGKVSWSHPRKYTIKWQVVAGTDYVTIKFSSDNRQNWEEIASYVPDTGSYLWTVPAVDSNKCVLWIYDSNNSSNVAVSDEPFEIFECLTNDLTGDCFVNLLDFATLARQWLKCGNEFDPSWCDQFRWFGPTLREFSGVAQSDPTPDLNDPDDNLWDNNALSMGRWDILWQDCEPNEGLWNQQYLEDRVTAIWPEHLEKRAQVLPILAYGTSWSSNDPDMKYIDSNHVSHWENYVYKVVDYLRRPPYNVEYFQVWNEATDNSWSWSGTMDQFMTNCYLPAAQVVQNLGGKVVWGGWREDEPVANYVSLLDSHNAWPCVDVLDLHYHPLTSWQSLYDALATRGYADKSIWQTEVGFSGNPNFVSKCYPRRLYWSLVHNWDFENKYKVFYFAQWAPDDPGAFGYHECLYSGMELWHHGTSLRTIADIFESRLVDACFDVTNDLGLQFVLDENGTGIESFEVDDGVVVVVHLYITDYESHSQIVLTLPEFSTADVSSIKRIDISGYSTDLTGSAYNNGSSQLTIPVPTEDDPASSVNTWGLDGLLYTFYVDINLIQ